MADALRFDHDRMVGESYKDYAARMSGAARAAEIDRDTALAELARVRAAVTALADGWVADLSQEPLDDHGRIVHAVTKDHAREVRETLAQP